VEEHNRNQKKKKKQQIFNNLYFLTYILFITIQTKFFKNMIKDLGVQRSEIFNLYLMNCNCNINIINYVECADRCMHIHA